MTTIANNSEIKFRTKFDIVTDENRSEINFVFREFFKETPEDAYDVLWELTYGSERALKEAEKLGIPNEKIQLFRNELRSQYEKREELPTPWLFGKVSDAFEELKKKSDEIVAYIVHQHIVESLYIEGFDRTLFLLSNAEEKNYFGGIRSLRFSKEEAAYLKTFHAEIGKLAKAMYEEKLGIKVEPLTAEALAETDFKVEDTKISETVVAEPEAKDDIEAKISETAESIVEEVFEEIKEPHEEEEEAEYPYKPLTVYDILVNEELFANFVYEGNDLNALAKLATLGVDLNEVYERRNEILTILNFNK